MKTRDSLLPSLLCLGLLLALSSLQGQICTPSFSGTAQGIFPETLSDICINALYDETISIRIPVDSMVIFQGDTVIAQIDSFVLEDMVGLPPGLNYTCQSSFCQIIGGNSSCVLIHGRPTQVGTFPIHIYSTYYAKIGGVSLIRPDTLIAYYTISVTSLSSGPTVSAATCERADGSISLSPIGTAPFTYFWNTGHRDSTIQNLLPNDYIVEVSDANACFIIDTIEVNNLGEVPEIIVEEIAWQGCSENGKGKIDLAINGGRPAYVYTWTHGDSIEDVRDLTPGPYTVLVTDADNCSATKDFMITSPPSLDLGILIQTNVLCAGEQTGSVSTLVSGGQQPYDLSWNTSPPSFSANLNSLAAGVYTLTVVDSLACQKDLDISITEPAPLMAEIEETGETATNARDGSIQVSISGGSAPYTYQWSNGETSPRIDSLKNDTYVLTTTDANGCERIDSVFLGQWAVGIEENREAGIASFSLSPNPNDGHLFLDVNFLRTEKVSWQIIDLAGRIVASKSYEARHKLKENIHLSSPGSGLYFLRLNTSSGVINQKFLIK